MHVHRTVAEVDANYPLEVGLQGSIGEALDAIAEAASMRPRSAEVAPVKDLLRAEWEEGAADASFPLAPARIVHDIRAVMGREDIVLCDTGAAKMWMARLYPTYEPNTCLFSNGLATMAFALPGAIATALVRPGRRVLAVMGDGAFLMSVAELETAVRERVALTVLVWVDGGYGLIGWKQDLHFGRRAAVGFGNPDFVELAKSFGANGYRIETADDLLPTLERALGGGGVSVSPARSTMRRTPCSSSVSASSRAPSSSLRGLARGAGTIGKPRTPEGTIVPILDKISNLGEGRKLKQLQELARLVNTYEPDVDELTDDELRAKTAEFRGRHDAGEDTRRPAARGLRRHPRGRPAHDRPAPLRRPAHGRRRPAPRQHRRDEDRGGQDPRLHPPGVPQRAHRQGRACRHGQRLPRQARLRVDGRHLPVPRARRRLIQASMTPEQRRPAYGADVTYGTNNEFGFDYLRDNMAMRLDHCVQRGHHFAIVDEVDSILIDEARTPLIISGMVADSAKWYQTFARVVPRLTRDDDYEVEESKYQVAVTEAGVAKVEEILQIDNLYDNVNTMLVHHLHNALRAKELYKRDVAYVVQQGEVKIVDEFTGRVLEGRRYSEGLHQAIEAKEGVRIKEENQTLATITIQNYFKMYDKLSGMTGTAKTQLTEFEETYKIGVVEIPTNRPNVRDDLQDLIYKIEDEKWDAVADDILARNEQGQPVLVGTVSIEKSERLSAVLNRRGIAHNVLNAKNHEKEAQVVAQAGRKGAVTVATNMAGRGVDILLGGNAEYLARQEMAAREFDNDRYLLFEMDDEERAVYESRVRADARQVQARRPTPSTTRWSGSAGLYVLGTERHESRRIDNQLRGRSGRQGDPGESLFYLSLEDDLMRMFASDKVGSIMERLKWPEGEPIEAKMVSRPSRTRRSRSRSSTTSAARTSSSTTRS